MCTQKLFLSFLLVAVVLSSQGCKTVMVGPKLQTEAVYTFGELTSTIPYDVDTVNEAAKTALDQLQLRTIMATKDRLSAKIIARDPEDKKVAVGLLAATENTTKLTIRIGTLGNEAKSKVIYSKIRDNLE